MPAFAGMTNDPPANPREAVIPANAGIQLLNWAPAFAGATDSAQSGDFAMLSHQS
jgi:hypothetical protein